MSSVYNLFDFAKGQSLHIPNKFSEINGWFVGLRGITEVLSVLVLLYVCIYGGL